MVVTGATGVLGGKIASVLAQRGAQLVLAGRDHDRLEHARERCAARSTVTFEATNLDSCGEVITTAVSSLGGLDGLVIAHGVAVFGNAVDTRDASATTVMTVNALAPMALASAALPHLARGSVIAAVSAVLADYPTAGMSDYTASKAAVSAWLSALRRETRRSGVTVCDIRAPHMDTGLEQRPVEGRAPTMPGAHDADEIVKRITDALREDATGLYYDARAGRVHLQ